MDVAENRNGAALADRAFVERLGISPCIRARREPRRARQLLALSGRLAARLARIFQTMPTSASEQRIFLREMRLRVGRRCTALVPERPRGRWKLIGISCGFRSESTATVGPECAVVAIAPEPRRHLRLFRGSENRDARSRRARSRLVPAGLPARRHLPGHPSPTRFACRKT